MTILRSEAFVLGRTPFKESSLIVGIFTRSDGVIRAVARGSRRPKSPFSGVLEPFNRVEAELSAKEGRDLWTLRSADLLEGSLDLYGEWNSAAVLYGALEVVDRGLPEQDPDERTFRLIQTLLDGLRTGAAPEVAWVYFLLWFLRIHGMMSTPDRCGACGGDPGKGELRFAPSAGGWVCGGCVEEGIGTASLCPEGRSLMAAFRGSALPGLKGIPTGQRALRDLKNVVYLAVTAFLGRPLSGAAALERLYGRDPFWSHGGDGVE
jgi:DNA repair protein RecO (recombination protein O)